MTSSYTSLKAKASDKYLSEVTLLTSCAITLGFSLLSHWCCANKRLAPIS